MLTALLIFSFTYLTISVQRLPFLHLDRTSGAMIGAVAMIAFGVLTIDNAYRAIDFSTIVLLLGMMIIVAHLKAGGFFDLVAEFILERAASGNGLLLTVIISAGVLSAFLVNDTVCLMMTPFVLLLAGRSRIDPKPYLIGLASAANIGSVATLVGNPQNMLIGTFSKWTYPRFFLAMAPVAFVGLAIDYLVLSFFFRKTLREKLDSHSIHRPTGTDRPLLYKSIFVMFIVVGGFAFGVRLSFMAILGASILLLVSKRHPEETFAKINWSLLLFFASLFVVVAGITRVGLVHDAHDLLRNYMTVSLTRQITTFSFASLVLSNIVSNVPYVMVVQHWITAFSSPMLMWLALSMSSTFAGNLTVAGSVANMIVLELSKDEAPFRFWEFTRVSGTVALLTWGAGTLLLILYAAVFKI